MRLRESVLVEKLEEYLHYCDLEKLAELAGEAFGGDCYISPKQRNSAEEEVIFEFEPNEHYDSDFDELEEEVTQ